MAISATYLVQRGETNAIYSSLKDQNSYRSLVIGPAGIGKTTLLKMLYAKCEEDQQFVPVFCTCFSDETLVCSLVRIKESISEQISQPIIPKEKFVATLSDTIKREPKSLTWHKTQNSMPFLEERREVGLISLMERAVDLDSKKTYKINVREAKIYFLKTIRTISRFLKPSQTLVLIAF